MEPSRQLSIGPMPIIKEGILLTLSRWWALQMAVVNEWGGRNSALLAEQLGEDILSWFTQSKEPLYIDDLEQILEKGLMSLNTMEEDWSIEEVAQKLMILHEDCLEGNFESIQKLREASAKKAGHSNIKKVVNDDDDDCSDTDESMDMAVDARNTGLIRLRGDAGGQAETNSDGRSGWLDHGGFKEKQGPKKIARLAFCLSAGLNLCTLNFWVLVSSIV